MLHLQLSWGTDVDLDVAHLFMEDSRTYCCGMKDDAARVNKHGTGAAIAKGQGRNEANAKTRGGVDLFRLALALF